MKKRTIILFTLLLANTILIAQTPEWQWASQAGGTGEDLGYAITIDNGGYTIVTGCFEDTISFGPHTLISNGFTDIFVAKMNIDGSWQWAVQAGGVDSDSGLGLTTDGTGNIYVTGEFTGFTAFGTQSLTNDGSTDLYVAKMDDSGNWLWATGADVYLSYAYRTLAISIDDDYNCYLTGTFQGTAYFGSYYINSIGSHDIFVAKIDTNGSWQWATQAGGNNFDYGKAISTDAEGNSYITGCFRDTASFGSLNITTLGNDDIFVAKIDTNGSWQWVSQAYGGLLYEMKSKISIDAEGNSYIIGAFYNSTTFGSYTVSSWGDRDIFVAKIDTYGSWQWASRAGGNYVDFGCGVATDDNGNSYVTGQSSINSTYGDIFVGKINNAGYWLWTVQAGSGSITNSAKSRDITVDNNGFCYVVGIFRVPVDFGSYTLIPYTQGVYDIFVAKLGNETSVENEIIPTEFKLSNFPNPFNPTTKIYYTIKERSNVLIDVYNLKGQLIKSFINVQQNAGDHFVIWNGKDDNVDTVSSGIYFYKLNLNGVEKAVGKCVLLK